jgi:hypothetical protein
MVAMEGENEEEERQKNEVVTDMPFEREVLINALRLF